MPVIKEVRSSDEEDSFPFSQTQRFTKSGNAAANTSALNHSSQMKMQQRNKINEPHLKLNLNAINSGEEDTTYDSDEYTKRSTQRSESALSNTPTPKARSFRKSSINIEKNESPSTPTRKQDTDKKSPIHSPSYGFDADKNISGSRMKSPRNSKVTIQETINENKQDSRSPEADIIESHRRPSIKTRQQNEVDKYSSRKSSIIEKNDRDNNDIVADESFQSKRVVDGSKAQKRMSNDTITDITKRDYEHVREL
ncbi:unnamed protein product [Didymodactylos carnosus]|uniref:Uncharacterized protein n=1 Tax=Didymodactylos carnosus TaxID=1234261 RepID=A0A814NNL3_9BILA|nr:unnamed protein product [Didymodactylos carnosus]CAF3859764.1 unnamed protein product [Didymodactylos carnosus]